MSIHFHSNIGRDLPKGLYADRKGPSRKKAGQLFELAAFERANSVQVAVDPKPKAPRTAHQKIRRKVLPIATRALQTPLCSSYTPLQSLHIVELLVISAEGDELIVAPFFDDASFIHYEDFVGVLDG